ncbi:hypothetical protein [Paraburkholderia sp. A3RO-2L]|jgi:hypothetical protein|uniref:hypothetical protein n=1 Tax=Paraburkholderia sp. A3RO-2L TaxID=3028376 RepID=UPI003DA84591
MAAKLTAAFHQFTSTRRQTRTASNLHARIRFATIAGVSFVGSLVALGLVDPKVVQAGCLNLDRAGASAVLRAVNNLAQMNLGGQILAGVAAVGVIAGLASIGKMRCNQMQAQKAAFAE